MVLEGLGCEAWCVDLRPYGHPLQHFIQGNFHENPLPENYFDVAFDISAIHHFGVEHYLPVEDVNADVHAAQKVWRSLKSGGLFYCVMDRYRTTYTSTDFFHSYNRETFESRIADGFEIEEISQYDVNCNPVAYGDPTMEILYAQLRKRT